MTDSRFVRQLAALIALSAGLALLFGGCGDSSSDAPRPTPKFDFTLEVEAKGDDGSPVAGVPIRLDGQVVGFSDANGVFRAILNEEPGKEIQLAVDNPEGYVVTTEDLPRTKPLQITRSLEGEYRGIPIRLPVELHSTRMEYLTWIELSCGRRVSDEHCADVPILLDGQEQARTNHQGIAHFVFQGIPGEEHEFRVAIPQSDSVNLQPSHPTYRAELERRTTVFHIAEEFSAPSARARPRPRPSPRPRPQPQPQPQPDPTPEEDDSGSGVIPLF